MKKFCSWVLLLSVIVFAGCTSKAKKSQEEAVLTFVASTSGVNDNGYMQAIHTALKHWADSHATVKTVIIEPKQFGDGDKAYLEWKKNSASLSKAMIVMGGSEYLDLVMKQSSDLTPNQHVLIIESKEKLDFPKGVSSFYINRKGASYLIGCLAKHHKSPLVMAALEKEAILQSYIKAFSDGLKDASGQSPEVLYLSEGYDGFQMPEKAKRITAEHMDSFIYPLNGESIKGVFEVLNSCKDADKVECMGLDMDCNSISNRIVGSMVVNFGKVFDIFLGAWAEGKEIPVYLQRGLKEGFVDVVLNDNFKTVNGVSAEDYKALKAEYMDKALEYEAN